LNKNLILVKEPNVRKPSNIFLSKRLVSMARFLHVKARKIEYQGGIKRFPVPDDKVDWRAPFPEYNPVDYTAPSVLAQPYWADFDIRKPDFNGPRPNFNALDGKGFVLLFP
jgi:hypothetical protein